MSSQFMAICLPRSEGISGDRDAVVCSAFIERACVIIMAQYNKRLAVELDREIIGRRKKKSNRFPIRFLSALSGGNRVADKTMTRFSPQLRRYYWRDD